MNRREVIPSMLGLGIGTVANAQTNTYKKPEECNCKCEGKVGPPGPKGDKGDKGEPGECNCKHEPKSLHVDFELNVLGLPIPVPDIIVNSPNSGETGLMDELWYFKRWNACIFFDYSKPIPEYIVFLRGGELPNWDKVSAIGMRVWVWHAFNPATGSNHACVVSLDKILANPSKIIQNWTSLNNSVTFGKF